MKKNYLIKKNINSGYVSSKDLLDRYFLYANTTELKEINTVKNNDKEISYKS